MRRLCAALLAGLLCLSLCGCGSSGRPDDVREGFYNIGLKALEECDKYLDMDATAQDAYDAVLLLYGRFDELGEADGPSESVVETRVFTLYSELMFVRNGSSTYDDVLEKRNELAECLNEKQR